MTATLSSRFFLGLEDHQLIAKLVGLLDGMTMGLHSMLVDFPWTIFRHVKRSADAIRKEMLVIIKERKAALSSGSVKTLDILSHMIVSSDPVTHRVLPENEVADKVMEQPEISRSKTSEKLNWDDLQKMKYIWNIALEAMRLIPPFQGTFREVITDITYEGFTIPKGWKIYWTVSTTDKDSKHFSNPEKFDPARFEQADVSPPYTNVPFGGERRETAIITKDMVETVNIYRRRNRAPI
ncbi:beta-amyrin 28-monooxygenase-like [Cornus florida]|uniref:beta-amyrin 28-monooxygenase-like n=1 Tax=Cornus florida TaxID=4283 RepID=UPI00289683EB|nr:beta-amyrin 28-monooxygenase-like [Cornus florida]